MRKHFYKLIARYLSLYIRPNNLAIEINPKDNLLKQSLGLSNYHIVSSVEDQAINSLEQAEYIILNGNLHFEKDIQAFLKNIHEKIGKSTRVIICYYSNLWLPLIKLATWLGIRKEHRQINWITHEDLANFALISGFEVINHQTKIIFPIWIPLVSHFFNKWFEVV
jgi:hypothetical protein